MAAPRATVFAVLLGCLAPLSGCLTPLIHGSADQEVSSILDQEQADVLDAWHEARVWPSVAPPPAKALLPAKGEPPREPGVEPDPQASSPPGPGAPGKARNPGADLASLARDPQQLNLAGSLRIATRHNRNFLFEKESLYLSALALTGARHDFHPQISSTIAYILNDSNAGPRTATLQSSLTLSQILASGGALTVTGTQDHGPTGVRQGRNYDASFSLQWAQPLLRGAGYEVSHETLTQAARNVVYAIRSFELFREDFTLQVLQGYYNLVLQKISVENQREQIPILEELTRRSKAFFDIGQGMEVDVLRARQEEQRARAALLSRQESYETALDRFKILMGLATDESVEIRNEAPTFVPFPFDLKSCVEAALANRLDLQTARDQLEDARRGIRIARNAMLPDLDLLATGTLFSDQEGSFGAQSLTSNGSDSVGITLSFPLDRLDERNALRQAEIALDRSQRAYTLLHDQILLDVRDSYRALRRTEQTLDLARETLEIEGRRALGAKLRYERGEIGNRDRVEAEQGRLRAQDDVIREKVNYETARIQMLRDVGILILTDEGIWIEPSLPAASAEGGGGVEEGA